MGIYIKFFFKSIKSILKVAQCVTALIAFVLRRTELISLLNEIKYGLLPVNLHLWIWNWAIIINKKYIFCV